MIVIAGGSSGIGLATATAAARRGARLVLAARNRGALDRIVAALRETGGDALAVASDLTRAADAEALVARAVEHYGRIDAFVNAVAVSVYGAFEDVSAEDFRRTVDVVFFGQVNAARAVLPQLERTAGALVCVGSVLAERGVPLQSAYCAGKHAVRGWLESLRVELQHRRSTVRVTLVNPATIDTPFYTKAKTYLGVMPRPLPPVYDPALVARAILRAAEGNERDIYVGGAAKALSVGQRVSPGLVDVALRRWAFAAQRTDRMKSRDAPSNLHEPLPEDGGIRGGAATRVRETSLYGVMAAHPIAAAFVALVGFVVAARWRRGWS